MDCSNISIKESSCCEGLGVFAKNDFLKGDMIEYGIARVLTNVDGNENPHLFTWSDEIPNTKWAILTGCAFFYNTSFDPNIRIDRDFQNDTFKMIALRDIQNGEELTHLYKSLEWRKCFSTIKRAPS